MQVRPTKAAMKKPHLTPNFLYGVYSSFWPNAQVGPEVYVPKGVFCLANTESYWNKFSDTDVAFLLPQNGCLPTNNSSCSRTNWECTSTQARSTRLLASAPFIGTLTENDCSNYKVTIQQRNVSFWNDRKIKKVMIHSLFTLLPVHVELGSQFQESQFLFLFYQQV